MPSNTRRLWSRAKLNVPDTSATLALKAGVPVKVVAQRLGHAKTDITNDIYAHALPSMQKEAAAKMASLLR